ncbi:ankyrin [Stipitochalara longipes BDJ]|nr:ankyrin [Stipitochalara longipes BDJ]
MSFGFSVDDFVALSTLTVSLYRSFKNAPGEFSEASRQLQSLHIVISDIADQAEYQDSLLNRNGAMRGHELAEIRENLSETMKELEDLHRRYQKMGRVSWSRFQLGQEDLASVRSKLTVQISSLNAFMSSLAVSALESVLSASGDRDDSVKGWISLELDLTTEGIPLEYIRENRQNIKIDLCSVVESNDLAGFTSSLEPSGLGDLPAPNDDSVYPDDSASQLHKASRISRKPLPDRHLSNSTKSTGCFSELSAEEEETRILVMNLTGLDVKRVRDRAAASSFSQFLFRFSPASIHQANAVCRAASYGKSSAPLKLLLDSGCDPSSYLNSMQDRSAIYMAAKAKQWSNVRLLMERGAKLQKRLIHMAALDDESEMIQLLLAQKVSCISIDACVEPKVCSLLLDGYDHKDLLVPLHELWSPLHFAAWAASPKVTATLLQRGVQVNKQTSIAKATALHLAIMGSDNSSAINIRARLAVIRILVEKGAEVNLTRKDGANAYDLAMNSPMKEYLGYYL